MHHRVPQQVENGLGQLCSPGTAVSAVQSGSSWQCSLKCDNSETLDQASRASQKVDEFPVERLRTLFVGQVSDAWKNNRLNMGEMSGQRLHGRNVHCRIFASPYQKSGNWCELWQHRLQL